MMTLTEFLPLIVMLLAVYIAGYFMGFFVAAGMNGQKRTIGCHSTCPEYLAYKKELEEKKAKEKLNKEYSPNYRKSYRPQSINLGKHSNFNE